MAVPQAFMEKHTTGIKQWMLQSVEPSSDGHQKRVAGQYQFCKGAGKKSELQTALSSGYQSQGEAQPSSSQKDVREPSSS